MTRTATLLILSIVLLSTSCTHNDGDIGEWFGTWQLEDMTVDGESDTGYGHDLFWQFQSDVFCMRKVTGYHEYYPRWGTWRQPDSNTLLLDFTHHDNKYPEGSSPYSPWPETHLLQEGVSKLRIVSSGNRKMVLEYTPEAGSVYRYYLTKW